MWLEGKDKFNALVNSTCAQRPPGLLRGICPPCQSRGGIYKFFTARVRAFANPGAIAELLNTHAVSYQNLATQRVLLEKKADWLICQGQE